MFYCFSTHCGQTTKDTGFLQIRHSVISRSREIPTLTLILLKWRIWWASNNASKWQIGFNSAFKRLIKLARSSKTHYQHNVKILNWVMFESCHLKDTRFANLFLLIAGNFKFKLCDGLYLHQPPIQYGDNKQLLWNNKMLAKQIHNTQRQKCFLKKKFAKSDSRW